MFTYVLPWLILLLTACGNRNFAEKPRSDAGPPSIENALTKLERNKPAEAYGEVLQTLSADKQHFLRKADTSAPNFSQQMIRYFNKLSEEEASQSLPIAAQAGIEKEGVSLLDFTQGLSQLGLRSDIPSSSSPGDSCPVEPDIKNLIKAAKRAHNLASLKLYRSLAQWAAFSVAIGAGAAGTDQAPVLTYHLRPSTKAENLIIAGIATLVEFSVMMRTVDRSGDYKISPAEAEAFFSADQGGKQHANNFYELLHVASVSMESLSMMHEEIGDFSEKINEAFASILKLKTQLSSLQLSHVGSSHAPSPGCGSDRTLTSSLSCVRELLVAKTNCAL
jgi:hypothetical protein